MDVVYFEGINCIFAEDQPQYRPLPTHRDNENIITSCWRLSFRERIRVLIKGRVYLQLKTFGEPLQPQLMFTINPVSKEKI